MHCPVLMPSMGYMHDSLNLRDMFWRRLSLFVPDAMLLRTEEVAAPGVLATAGAGAMKAWVTQHPNTTAIEIASVVSLIVTQI